MKHRSHFVEHRSQLFVKSAHISKISASFCEQIRSIVFNIMKCVGGNFSLECEIPDCMDSYSNYYILLVKICLAKVNVTTPLWGLQLMGSTPTEYTY